MTTVKPLANVVMFNKPTSTHCVICNVVDYIRTKFWGNSLSARPCPNTAQTIVLCCYCTLKMTFTDYRFAPAEYMKIFRTQPGIFEMGANIFAGIFVKLLSCNRNLIIEDVLK